MKKITILGAFLMLGAFLNKGYAQTLSSELEVTVTEISADKMSGMVYSEELGRSLPFVAVEIVASKVGERRLVIKPVSEVAALIVPIAMEKGVRP